MNRATRMTRKEYVDRGGVLLRSGGFETFYDPGGNFAVGIFHQCAVQRKRRVSCALGDQFQSV